MCQPGITVYYESASCTRNHFEVALDQNLFLSPGRDAVKIEIMYRVNAAKYAQHADLRAELLSTGSMAIDGCASTSWATRGGGRENWSTWNGIIHTRIREELRPEGERDTALLQALCGRMDAYLRAEGGAQLPLPGDAAGAVVAAAEP